MTENIYSEILDTVYEYNEKRLPAIIPIPGMKGSTGIGIQNIKKAVEKEVKFLLPVDAKITQGFKNDGLFITKPIDEIPDGWMGLDIGEASISLFEQEILESKTILWNGPMGVFEFSNFAQGTFEVANALSKATLRGAYTLVGGGDSVSAISQAGLESSVSFVSTGGGAMLEMIEGKELPGIAAIKHS